MDFLFLTSGGANSKSLRWILQAGKFPRFGEKSDRVFHYYLVTRMTDWAQTLTGVLFHVCVGSHKVRTLIFAIYQCCGMALRAWWWARSWTMVRVTALLHNYNGHVRCYAVLCLWEPQCVLSLLFYICNHLLWVCLYKYIHCQHMFF